jgi:hypothetical protein
MPDGASSTVVGKQTSGMLVAMLERVISGGQTGVDQAGWRAACAHGITTGGAMPKGYMTEEVPRPDFAALYGAVELPTASYAERTRRNVEDSDATLWFGDWMSPGGKTTLDACRLRGKPFLIVYQGATRPGEVRDWIVAKGIRTLNVAGNRESKAPGIGDRVERFLAAVFKRLGLRPVG